MINHIPPELTYSVGNRLLRIMPMPTISFESSTELGNLALRNPLGLGAGVDKDGDLVGSTAKLGLGFITVGSVTLKPRIGNPKPRFVKYPELRAMVNSVGLPSLGLLEFMRKLEKLCLVTHRNGVVLIVSIAGFGPGEFSYMTRTLSRTCIDALELNIGSPTYGGAWIRNEEALLEVMSEAGNIGKLVMLKLPLGAPVSWYRALTRYADKHGLGLTIANTLPVKEPRLSTGYGGLSGLPIYPLTKLLIAKTRRWGFRGPIVGIGGVFTGRQVMELLGKGANAVGIVTAFIYGGPLGILRILRELSSMRTFGNHPRDSRSEEGTKKLSA